MGPPLSHIAPTRSSTGLRTPLDVGGRSIDFGDVQRDLLPNSRSESNPWDEEVSLYDISLL